MQYARQVLGRTQSSIVEVEGNRSRGRAMKCWLDAIKDDLRQQKLQAETCQNCSEWRKRLQTASHTRAGQSTLTCSKLTIEILEQGVKYVQS